MPKTYSIVYDNGIIRDEGSVPAPERNVEMGDIYKFTRHTTTLVNVDYVPGDTLKIVDRTSKAPHHRRSSLGNYVVECKHFTSVWTNIEWMIAEGRLKLSEAK